jgi:glutaredoxin
MAENRQIDIVLYTRDGCHLCEDAQQVLSDYGLVPRLVDIDGDKALRARFDTCVPVVEIDGRIRFRGKIEPRLLQRIIRNLA